ncbi:MAG TPA: hypothetical protein VGN72_14290 [Tepidisphaeraceae bacterium]|jgi:hypothetical protein|nr:hypothetical protein [Tepidisphaeraceae bacterium]
MIDHVTRLLDDDRLRIDTVRGRRAITEFVKDVKQGDRGTDVKRTMTDLDKPDRTLQSQMPLGESIDVVVSQKKWGFIKTPMGRLHVVCVSPTRDLVAGGSPAPMSRGDVTKVLSSVPPAPAGVPSTVVIVATGGVALEAHEMADRGADRTVIIAEPNDAGGWSVAGPVETKALVDLFDPEPDDEKRRRIVAEIEAPSADLGGAGVATDRLAGRLQLPLPFVESALKAYAKSHSGLTAKRLDGRLVLFREGSVAPSASSSSSSSTTAGGSGMPLIDKMKALFARKGETEKKIAFLAERRAALSQQRDRAYDEIHAVEGKESALRAEFKTAPSEAAKRRVTSHMLQLRKELDRRQQMLSVFNQQIDVVSTHLHNLELLQQGQTAKLPDTDEITTDAARAEEMLAELQASTEAAAGASSTIAGGLSSEEQALFEELERESAEPPAAAPAIDREVMSTMPKTPDQPPAEQSRQPAKRSEPEAG